MSKQELFGTTVQSVMIQMTTEFLYFILCSENPAATISRLGVYTSSTNTVSVWGWCSRFSLAWLQTPGMEF